MPFSIFHETATGFEIYTAQFDPFQVSQLRTIGPNAKRAYLCNPIGLFDVKTRAFDINDFGDKQSFRLNCLF
jgi:hypothetical protein